MKTVFTNSQCAHVWAQQSQPNGHSDSMSFDGDTLYSYRTPIARIVGGMNVALVTSRRYSITTSSKHMPQIGRALPGDMECFYVPIVTAGSKREHTENLEYLVTQYMEQCAKIRRARDVSDWHYATLSDMGGNVHKYAAAFELPPRLNINYKKDSSDLKLFRAEREKRLNTPANQAKREHARNMRATYKANAEARKAEKARIDAAERIERFRAGDNTSVYGLPYAICRVSRDGSTVQTSQGANVSVDDARAALNFIGGYLRDGAQFYASERGDGSQYMVGEHFRLLSIDAAGIVTIGCHRFERAELSALAALLHVPHYLPPASVAV